MSYDELELDSLGERKTALFIIPSDTDGTFDFVTALCVSQMMNILCTKADDEYGGRLPIHVRCLFDEFANIKIPDMQRLIAVIRSREISACLILQSQSQLKAIYKDHADTILGNCDATLFLGGKESSTLKEMSEMLGKETIDLYNTSDTRGTSRSYGINYQKTGKELMSKDELAVMDGMGFWTRSNTEICLLAKRGKPKRNSAGVHQLIISPIERHSKKPDEARTKIELLMGDVPRIELFARQKSEGWDVWGNEVESDITMKGSEENGICAGSEGLDKSKDQSDVQSD